VSEELFNSPFATNVKSSNPRPIVSHAHTVQIAVRHMAADVHSIFISITLSGTLAVMAPYLPPRILKGASEQMTYVLSKNLGSKDIKRQLRCSRTYHYEAVYDLLG